MSRNGIMYGGFMFGRGRLSTGKIGFHWGPILSLFI